MQEFLRAALYGASFLMSFSIVYVFFKIPKSVGVGSAMASGVMQIGYLTVVIPIAAIVGVFYSLRVAPVFPTSEWPWYMKLPALGMIVVVSVITMSILSLAVISAMGIPIIGAIAAGIALLALLYVNVELPTEKSLEWLAVLRRLFPTPISLVLEYRWFYLSCLLGFLMSWFEKR